MTVVLARQERDEDSPEVTPKNGCVALNGSDNGAPSGGQGGFYGLNECVGHGRIYDPA